MNDRPDDRCSTVISWFAHARIYPKDIALDQSPELCEGAASAAHKSHGFFGGGAHAISTAATPPLQKERTAMKSHSRLTSGKMAMLVGAAGLLAACIFSPVRAEDEYSGAYLMPFADPEMGRQLFVGKACVVCHSVNGIGGQVGPALDANASRPYIDPFDMAARMWRGAATMLLLQEMALGYQIDLTGQELAHIARFLRHSGTQRSFSSDDVPEHIRDLMVDKVYEELENDETAE